MTSQNVHVNSVQSNQWKTMSKSLEKELEVPDKSWTKMKGIWKEQMECFEVKLHYRLTIEQDIKQLIIKNKHRFK